jgi:hypothetical protein
MLRAAYVSSFTARQVLHGDYDACKTSQVLLSANIEYRDTEQSLAYPPERLMESVGTDVTPVESVMAYVAYLNSVEQNFTAAIKTALTSLASPGCFHFTTKN